MVLNDVTHSVHLTVLWKSFPSKYQRKCSHEDNLLASALCEMFTGGSQGFNFRTVSTVIIVLNFKVIQQKFTDYGLLKRSHTIYRLKNWTSVILIN